ncbi:unnamed protein product [Amoebophrya sp. A120]|nr:unnamed protein product [Amoebophrya sp. A120]|eukprot:GSA120T00002048001.1
MRKSRTTTSHGCGGEPSCGPLQHCSHCMEPLAAFLSFFLYFAVLCNALNVGELDPRVIGAGTAGSPLQAITVAVDHDAETQEFSPESESTADVSEFESSGLSDDRKTSDRAPSDPSSRIKTTAANENGSSTYLESQSRRGEQASQEQDIPGAPHALRSTSSSDIAVQSLRQYLARFEIEVNARMKKLEAEKEHVNTRMHELGEENKMLNRELADQK